MIHVSLIPKIAIAAITIGFCLRGTEKAQDSDAAEAEQYYIKLQEYIVTHIIAIEQMKNKLNEANKVISE